MAVHLYRLKMIFCKQYLPLDLHDVSGISYTSAPQNRFIYRTFTPPFQYTAATEWKTDEYGLFVSLLREMHSSLSPI